MSSLSRLTPLLVALVLAAAVLPATARHAGTGHAHSAPVTAPAVRSPVPLAVRDATVVAVPPGATETSVFMTLRNTGRAAVVLTGVRSAVAGHTMLMRTRRDTQNRTGMVTVPTLTVPAGRTLTLKPSGDHLMLMDLKRPLKVGETLTLTLTTRSGSLSVKAVVRKP